MLPVIVSPRESKAIIALQHCVLNSLFVLFCPFRTLCNLRLDLPFSFQPTPFCYMYVQYFKAWKAGVRRRQRLKVSRPQLKSHTSHSWPHGPPSLSAPLPSIPHILLDLRCGGDVTGRKRKIRDSLGFIGSELAGKPGNRWKTLISSCCVQLTL